MKLINFPNQPNANMDEAAKSLYSMYRSYVDAGFEKRQAMDILLTMIRASTTSQPPRK